MIMYSLKNLNKTMLNAENDLLETFNLTHDNANGSPPAEVVSLGPYTAGPAMPPAHAPAVAARASTVTATSVLPFEPMTVVFRDITCVPCGRAWRVVRRKR